MASVENKNIDGSRQSTKENYTCRKKSGVPKWLKKHTKWGRRKQISISNESMRMSGQSGVENPTLFQDDQDKKKESIWKKGLGCVCSPKSSMLNEPPGDAFSKELMGNFLNPFLNSYYCLPQLPLLHMAYMNSPEVLVDDLCQEEAGPSLHSAVDLEQAYMEQWRHKMAFVEHLRLQHFIMTNLQKAALAEQARVAASVLQQAYGAYELNPIMEKCHSELMDYQNRFTSEDMEIDQTVNYALLQLQNTKMRNERSNLVSSKQSEKQTIPEGLKVCYMSDRNQTKSSDNFLSPLKAIHSIGDQNNTDNHCSTHFSDQPCRNDSSIAIHQWSPKQWPALTECSSDNCLSLESQKNILNKQKVPHKRPIRKKLSPKNCLPPGGAYPLQNKRLKRNAISAEPSCYNEVVVTSGFFNNPLSLAVPKPLK